MKTFLKYAGVGTFVALMLLIDLPLQFTPDAQAVAGVRRRTARRTAVVVGGTTAAAASASTSAANQQAAAASQQAAQAQAQADAANQQLAQAQAEAAAAQQQAATAQAQAAPLTAALPMGAVLTTLPEGCTQAAIDNVEYYVCGPNYLKAAFQGSQLVYVTAKP